MFSLIPILLLCVATPVQTFSSLVSPYPIAQVTMQDLTHGIPPQVSAESTRPKLPASPAGKSTVIGGQIASVDAVRDQFKLRVFGGRTMTILYDERTKMFRDGLPQSILSLRPDQRASIETTLDGTSVFALRIHMVSHPQEGEARGQVVRFESGTGKLYLTVGIARSPLTLHVTGLTTIEHDGQDAQLGKAAGVVDLVNGAIVFALFASAGDGEGLATKIQLIASPGSTFIFSGNVTFLDVRAGKMVVVDPSFEQPQNINFDASAFPDAAGLHEGASVKVTTQFDGTRFTASQIMLSER